MVLGWRLWQSLATIWESPITTLMFNPPCFWRLLFFLLSVSPTYSLQIPTGYIFTSKTGYLLTSKTSKLLFVPFK